jgi:predicted DCC family thiol-disulfide oxidoreductase YuxK
VAVQSRAPVDFLTGACVFATVGDCDGINQSMATEQIVLFDGDCGMCSAFVRFVLRNSIDPTIIFISLGSEKGRQLLAQHGIDPGRTNSIVFIAAGQAHVYSNAIIELARSFRSPWNAVRFLALVPRVIRDGGYQLIARYRKRLMPLSHECPMFSPSERSRIYLD